VSVAAQPARASAAPWWVLAVFSLSTLIAFTWASLSSESVVGTSPQSAHFAEGYAFNVVDWLGTLALVLLQCAALAGLFTRQHWGRPVATIASSFWVVSVVTVLFATSGPGFVAAGLLGVVAAALVWWGLHRRWEPGVETTFTRDHPTAPRYIVGLTAVGTALAVVWLAWLYLYLAPLLLRLYPEFGAASWYWIATFGFLFSLPLWVVQGLAFLGLLGRRDWGVVLAVIACLLWVMSIIGLPFGIAGLFVLWRWRHPAIRPQVSGAPA